MANQRNVNAARSAQLGFLMRSYRESFSGEDGRNGISQSRLLERMSVVDKEYSRRSSHGTVSNWESGKTRPTVARLLTFGKALDLSQEEMAGLILLAGLAPDFPAAAEQAGFVVDSGGVANELEADSEEPEVRQKEHFKEELASAARFMALRCLPLGALITGFGYALGLIGWNESWMPIVYMVVVTTFAVAHGLLNPGASAGLREFFWVSVFVILTTPVLQFAPIGMDPYNFYTLDALPSPHLPWLLALLVNLVLASLAGMLFQFLKWWQYPGNGKGGTDALRRATLVALPPVAVAYTTVMMISNLSVAIQLAVLLPVLGVVFGILLALRDPAVGLGESDRRVLFPSILAIAIVSIMMGIGTILVVHVSPDIPSVLPDHNLFASWEIDFEELGYSREEALERVNLGYLWHGMFSLAYMALVVGGSAVWSIYRIGGDSEP